MSAFFTIPFWLGFTALAFPLLIVSLSTLNATEIYEIDDDPEADVASRQSMLEDGTVTQRVGYAGFGAASVVTFFGPFGIAANARAWAAIAVLLGMSLTCIGLIGLLHFPTRVPLVDYSALESMHNGEPSDATEDAS